MAVSQRLRLPAPVRRALAGRSTPASSGVNAAPSRTSRVASPAPIAVIYRWGTWLLALGLLVTGASGTYGPDWTKRPQVYLLLGLTLAVNLLLTVALRPYIRLMRRFPPFMLLDIVFCLAVYAQSSIWTSPFQFYSYSALMLPVAIFFYSGALAGSVVFLALDVALLYGGGYSFAWARANGVADTYLMQLAIVPLLAFCFAYPNRLYSQLRRAQQRLAVVEREQILLAERTRIAGSLHDSVAQILFGIGMLVESAQARLAHAVPNRAASEDAEPPAEDVSETLREVQDLAARGNREMRRAIYSLREQAPAGDGLPAALDALLAELAARTGVATHLTVGEREQLADGAQDADATAIAESADTTDTADTRSVLTLPEPAALALYKVAREALANIEKHAGAMNVWVTLAPSGQAVRDASRVTLTVRDDGHGFRRPLLAVPGDPDEDELGLLHFGMSNMRSAVEAVGGRLEIASGAGRGTTVTASVPIE